MDLVVPNIVDLRGPGRVYPHVMPSFRSDPGARAAELAELAAVARMMSEESWSPHNPPARIACVALRVR